MTINPSVARPQHLSVPKSEPTTSATKTSARPQRPHLTAEAHSRSSSRAGQGRKLSASTTRADVSNAKNDKATAALIRRVLCPQSFGHGSEQNLQRERGSPQPLDELLPPLTSSNDVDLQLYALIAIVMKEFIYAWYSKITPDSSFAEELIQVVAHCTRALEQRIRRVDVDALLLDEIPALIEAHVLAYRTALNSPLAARSQTQFRAVYHALIPHRALSPVPDTAEPTTVSKQKERETKYRQLLAQGISAVLLPTEDLENVCVRTLVGDILADLLLGEIVSDRVCEGWFLWATVTKLVSELKTEEGVGQSPKDRLGMFNLYPAENHGNDLSPNSQSRLSAWFWRFLQWCYLGYISIRFVLSGLFRAASAPSSFMAVRGPVSTSGPGLFMNPAKEDPTSTEGDIARLPVIRYRLFGMMSQLTDVPRRMPWLGGLLALVQHQLLAGPGKFGETGSVIDRFLRETIQTHLLIPSLLPMVLLSIRATLFPSNARPPSTPLQPQSPVPEATIETASFPNPTRDADPSSLQSPPAALQPASASAHPSETQIQGIKRACASSIASLIPRQVALATFCISTPTRGKSSSTTGAALESRPAMSFPTRNASDAPTSGTKSGSRPERDQSSSLSGRGSRPLSRSTRDNSNANPSSTTGISPTGEDIGVNEGGEGHYDEQQLLLSAIERDILDLFSDSCCNKHLVFAIIEAVLVKVVPELADHGVAELMAERGL